MDLSNEQIEQIFRDACPYCAKDVPWEMRADTGEIVHRPAGPHSIVLCLAMNLRKKYSGQ